MTDRNQGEGNREAARDYNEATRDHIRNNDIEAEAEQAEPASDEEARKLKEAEREGRSRAREFDPQVERDDD